MNCYIVWPLAALVNTSSFFEKHPSSYDSFVLPMIVVMVSFQVFSLGKYKNVMDQTVVNFYILLPLAALANTYSFAEKDSSSYDSFVSPMLVRIFVDG